jgi:hypothetical protein
MPTDDPRDPPGVPPRRPPPLDPTVAAILRADKDREVARATADRDREFVRARQHGQVVGELQRQTIEITRLVERAPGRNEFRAGMAGVLVLLLLLIILLGRSKGLDTSAAVDDAMRIVSPVDAVGVSP